MKKSKEKGKLKISKKLLIIIGCTIFIVIGCLLLFFLVINKHTYYVTFNTTGGSLIENTTTDKTGSLTLPKKDPIKENYVFNGWKYDNKYIFNKTLIHEDVQLKADWIEPEYEYVEVIFSPGDGFDSQVVLIEKNQRILKPINPEKKGDDFKGWYLNNTEFDFNQRIKENIVLIGKWNDSSIISSQDNKFYCFDKSFKLKDSKCTKIIKDKPVVEKYCDAGLKLTDDMKCMKIDTSIESIPGTPVYICDDGYTLNDNKCTKSNTVNPTKNLYCTDGKLEGNSCYDYSDKDLMGINVCGYKNNPEYVRQQKEKIQIYCMNEGGKIVVSGCQWFCRKNVRTYLSDAKVSYNCPSGYALNNGKCNGTIKENAKIKEYTCTNGYINSGSKCYDKEKAIKYEKAKEKIVCREGFKESNGSCVMNFTMDALKK